MFTPVIDRTYAFEEIPAALRYQEEDHAAGKVVITVGSGGRPGPGPGSG